MPALSLLVAFFFFTSSCAQDDDGFDDPSNWYVVQKKPITTTTTTATTTVTTVVPIEQTYGVDDPDSSVVATTVAPLTHNSSSATSLCDCVFIALAVSVVLLLLH